MEDSRALESSSFFIRRARMGRTIYKDEDLIGKTFGKLTILSVFKKEVGKIKREKNRYAHCKCTCGKEKDVSLKHLFSGKIKSCGCLEIESRIKHGLHNHPLYVRWLGMIQRCTNPKSNSYKNYGARGIKVCPQWMGILGLKNYIKFCINNGWKKELTVDRINNNGDYEPSNIRFVGYHIQGINQRISSKNTSGYRGVSFGKSANKWLPTIRVNNKRIYLGRYDTKKEAVEARNKFIIDHNLTEYPIQEWRGEE